MRENLLKKQPTWGLRRAQGTGQKSATPATLTKVILVLLTMFLLPSAAWGLTTVTKTITFDKNKGDEVTIDNAENFPNAIPVTVNEKVGSNTNDPSYGYDSNVMIINSGALLNTYSYSNNKAVFTLDEDASTEFPNWFVIRIPGNYPEKPTEVTLYFSYTTSISNEDEDGYCAKIQFGNEENYTDTGDSGGSKNYLTTGLNGLKFSANGTDGIEITGREGTNSLDIYIFLDGEDGVSPTFTIEKIEMKYSTDFYNLSVAGIPVTGVNKDDVLNNGTVKPNGTLSGDGTVSFTEGALTLNGASISGGGIYTTLESLEIDLKNTNTIETGGDPNTRNGIMSTKNGTLTFVAASNSSLEITSTAAAIKGFQTINGNLKTQVPYTIKSKNDNYPNQDLYRTCEIEGDSVAITWMMISEKQTYSLWVGGVQVTGENKDNITGETYTAGGTSYQSISGSVSFNPTGNILTLDGASISSTSSRVQTPIISNLPNLTININRTCYLAGYQNGYIYYEGGGVMSLNTNAELVFTTNYTSSSNADSPTMQLSISPGSIPIASGFKSISTDKQLIYIQTSNYYSVRRIAQPTISLVDGNLQLSDNNILDATYPPNTTLKYKITDATDQSSTPIAETYDSQATVNIGNPCTIDAWAEYQDQESDLATAKYFGFVEELNVEYDGNESEITLPDVVPAIASSDGVTLTISTSNSPIINKNDNDKWVVAGLGKATLDVSITGPTQNAPYQILNEKLTLTVKSAPAPPTIGLDEGTYFAGTVVTLTPTVVGVTTKYQWDNESEPTVLDTSSPNMPTIPTGTHTLTAWSEYSYTTDVTEVTLKGSEVEATYTAGNYDLIIAGNEVDATMTVTGEGIEGTVSYNKGNHTLTLNKAKINGPIESNIEELTVYLIGENTITVNSDNLPFMYKGSASATLTFNSSNSDEGGLTMTSEDIASGYEVDNSFESEDNYYSNLWTKTYNSSTGETYIYYNVQYGIIVGDYNVSKENMNNITDSSSSEVLTYSPEDNILNLPLALSDESVISHRKELILQVSGSTALKSINFVKDADFYDGTGTLTITGDSDYDGVNSLSLGNNSSGVITGFSSVDLTLPMHVSSPENFTGWTASVTSATIKDETWDLSSEFEHGLSYVTFCYPYEDVYIPSTITPYVITGISGSSVTTQALSYIPKGVPVLLSKTNNTATTATFNKNELKYAESSDNPVTASEGKALYVLYNNEFVKVTSGTNIYGCYMDLTGVNLPSGTRSLTIDGDDEGTTALREVRSEGVKGEKWNDGEWYTLQGRKFTTKPTKPGLYILNGKKIVVK